MTFDSKMTFEKHLRSVSRAASQRLGISRKSWWVFHLCSVSRAASQRLGIFMKSWRVFNDRSLHGICFRGFVMVILEYCSAVWWLATDTHLKLLDRAAMVPSFNCGGVFECDIAHCWSVAVFWMLYKIRCNPMHPLNVALPGLYVLVQVTHGALDVHRYTYELPRCWTLPYCQTFIPLSVSLIFPFLFFLSLGWYCGAGVFGLIGCISLSLSLSLPTSFNNNNKNENRSDSQIGCQNNLYCLLW